jgi:nanoRNase/pAp phosphatase (c-di-AMP/oligoRNAs hydrolase)
MQPDDDSIASVLVMYDYVATKFPNKKVEIRYSSAPLTKWQYFEHFDRIQWVDDITRTDLGGFDCIIFLDSPRFDRFTSEPEVLKNLPAIKICIDHHISPPDTFDISYIAPGPAATHHLYALFYEGESIAPRLAELLLLGILGDTVMLKHVSLQYLATYSLVGELLQKASTTIEAFTARYSLYPQKVYELVQGMIDNQEFMEIGSWPQFSASYLDRDFVAEHKATDDLIDQAYRRSYAVR